MGYLRYRAAKTVSLEAPAKPILLELAQIADLHGFAWPSQQTIAEAVGYDERTVRRELGELLKKGHIKQAGWHFYKSQGKRTRRYLVLPTFERDKHIEPDSQSASTEDSNRTGMPIEPDTERLEPDSQSDKGLSKVVSSSKAPAAASFISETEEKQLQEVWEYHQQSFDKNDRLTKQRKAQGLKIIRFHQKNNSDPVKWMKRAIDVAEEKSREANKGYLSNWHAIFSNEDTYESLACESVE